MMKTRYYGAWVATVCLAFTVAQGAFVSAHAKDANEDRGQLSGSDYKFARKAASGGMMEVTLGKIAAQRSTNLQDLKTFAANTLPILQEHLKLAEDMKDSTRHEVTRNR